MVNKIRPIISIIVPVYNTGLYLEECLNSIHNQTFKDYEVIKGKMDDVFLNATGYDLEVE